MEIRNLLKARAHDAEKHRNKSEERKKERKMKKNWLLAAAVVDRTCAIAYIMMFVGGVLWLIIVAAQRESQPL